MEETKNETFDVAALTTYELAQKLYPNEDFSRFKDVADSFDALLNAETLDVTGPRRLELEGVSGAVCAAMWARAQMAPTVRRVVAVGERTFGVDMTSGLDRKIARAVSDAVSEREPTLKVEISDATIDDSAETWRAFRFWRPSVVFESAENGAKNVAFVLLGIKTRKPEGEGDEE